jgi:hypothetical protein
MSADRSALSRVCRVLVASEVKIVRPQSWVVGQRSWVGRAGVRLVDAFE